MRYVKLSIAALLFIAVSLAYGQEAKQEQKSAAKPEAKQEAAPEAAKPEAKQGKHGHQAAEKRFVAAVGADGVQHVEITGGEYFFDPNVIVVKVNVPVELRVKKTAGYVPHNIVVDAPDAGIKFKIDFASKEPADIKFTPARTGTYPMYCDKQLLFFKSHRERGMEGRIEVVE